MSTKGDDVTLTRADIPELVKAITEALSKKDIVQPTGKLGTSGSKLLCALAIALCRLV